MTHPAFQMMLSRRHLVWMCVPFLLLTIMHGTAAVKVTFIEVEIEKLSGQGGGASAKERDFEQDDPGFCGNNCNKFDICELHVLCFENRRPKTDRERKTSRRRSLHQILPLHSSGGLQLCVRQTTQILKITTNCSANLALLLPTTTLAIIGVSRWRSSTRTLYKAIASGQTTATPFWGP